MDGIDLQDSFVLDWSVINDEFVIQLEVSIWPASPYFSKPTNNEYTCYKRAKLIFKSFSSISGLLEKQNVAHSIDPDGSIDYGNIDSFRETENGYQINANFGAVKVTGGKVVFGICT